MISQEDNPFFEQKIMPKPKAKILVDALQGLIIAAFIVIIVYLFIATPNEVDGNSMLPNFEDKQLLLTNKLSQWLGNTPLGEQLGLDYGRGDVVVVQLPDWDKAIIKRVIGIPGDRVSVRNGNVYINGQKATETFLPAERRTNAGTYLTEGLEITVKANEYILMGDNRERSLDSRFIEIGPVPRQYINGRVILRYWPLDKFGLITKGEIRFLSQ